MTPDKRLSSRQRGVFIGFHFCQADLLRRPSEEESA